jgi:hypothetical protein
VFFGVLFFETLDSFLVGASARLVMDEDHRIRAEPLNAVAVSRFFKTNLLKVTAALPKFQFHYFDYLLKRGKSLLPDYLVDDILEQVSDFVKTSEIDESPAEIHHEPTKATVKSDYEQRGVYGVSELAFIPYSTSEKIH